MGLTGGRGVGDISGCWMLDMDNMLTCKAQTGLNRKWKRVRHRKEPMQPKQ